MSSVDIEMHFIFLLPQSITNWCFFVFTQPRFLLQDWGSSISFFLKGEAGVRFEACPYKIIPVKVMKWPKMVSKYWILGVLNSNSKF